MLAGVKLKRADKAMHFLRPAAGYGNGARLLRL